MDYHDRRKIDLSCNIIASRIDMRKLLPELIKNEVFIVGDVNISKWQKTLDQEATVREILTAIKKRGPRAFTNLIRSLRRTNHDDVADVLDGKAPLFPAKNVQNNNISLTNEALMESNTEDNWYYKTGFQTSQEPLVINVKPATKFMDEPDDTAVGKYYMRKKPHGYVLIITIIDYIAEPIRTAAKHDQANLKQLFEEMGFEVSVPDPGTVLSGAEINRLVKEFSKRNFDKVDSCFVIISAHGNEIEHNSVLETEIHGIDYNLPGAEKVLCRDLVDMFTADNCKHLVEKPKVFIFQACRDKVEWLSDRCATDGCISKEQPRYHSDILIAHSTMPGYKSYRDEFNGSWYIQILCEVFMRYACTMHLDDLFKKVDEILKTIRTEDGRSQTSTVKMMGFSKHLFLNPGIFDDS